MSREQCILMEVGNEKSRISAVESSLILTKRWIYSQQFVKAEQKSRTSVKRLHRWDLSNQISIEPCHDRRRIRSENKRNYRCGYLQCYISAAKDSRSSAPEREIISQKYRRWIWLELNPRNDWCSSWIICEHDYGLRRSRITLNILAKAGLNIEKWWFNH